MPVIAVLIGAGYGALLLWIASMFTEVNGYWGIGCGAVGLVLGFITIIAYEESL